MRVFQPTYQATNGKRKKSPTWHVTFKDHNGIHRRVPAFTVRSASESLGRKLETLAAKRAVREPMDTELAQWIDEIPDQLREKLIEWGVIDRKAMMVARPIQEHIDAWFASLLANGRTPAYAGERKRQVEAMTTALSITRYSEIRLADVEQYLVELAAEPRNLSARSRNKHAGAVRAFCRWMVIHGRAHSNPLLALGQADAASDRRLVRRALTVEELQKLILAAQDGPERYKTTGKERAVMYWMAAETGFRANEIRSLTRASFDLDGELPVVTVAAGYSKRRREDRAVLSDGLSQALRLHLGGKHPSAQAFKVPHHSAEMIREDLVLAGIAVEDDTGAVLDFHALRTTCATNLARGGAHPAVAKARLRHSTISLTMDIYTRLGLDEHQGAALEALPSIEFDAEKGSA